MKEENRDSGSFLERWSRKKRGLDAGTEHDGDPAGEALGEDAAATEETARNRNEADEPVAEKDFADFNFEELDYDSDYKQFMEKDVTPEARQKALRKLWVSNPVLANMDGLDDYCEDYTDAAVCLPKGTMKTLYQYGRGFLDDDEVAEWEALGQESKKVAEAEAQERRAEARAAAKTESAAAGDEAANIANRETGDASSGPGAACAAAAKQDEAEMLAEYDAEISDPETPPNSSRT